MKKILLIGCGHMGEALLVSWIKVKKYNITIVDPVKSKLLKQKYKNKNINILSTISLVKEFIKFDTIIFATKPIHLQSAINEISNFKLNPKTIIASIVAGKKINIFKKNFINIKNIFRIMPNMPASIGESMNCVACSKSATKIKKNQIIELFSYSGKTIILQNENAIDMATAVSGSGPGFVFNIIDAMEKAAIKLGFEKRMAKLLVVQTFKGSINLLVKNNFNAQDLVKMVATKGGTTEAGLKIMKNKRFHKIFETLVKESYKKAKAQGK